MIMENRDKINPGPHIEFRIVSDGKVLPFKSKEQFMLALWERLTEMKQQPKEGSTQTPGA